MSKLQPKADAAINGLAGLDKLLEHRSRLGACVLLSGADAISFSSLRELLGETDGNLGAHLQILEDAGYIRVEKSFIDKKPRTHLSTTAKGRAQFEEHIAALREICDL